MGFLLKVMAQGLPVFEWFLHVLYLLVPPQWTVCTQRLHLSINIHRSKTEINIAIYKPRREFIMNLKHFLSHIDNTRACQTKFIGLENYRCMWSYGSWIYNYLCNQCLLPLKLWVCILLMARCTGYNNMW